MHVHVCTSFVYLHVTVYLCVYVYWCVAFNYIGNILLNGTILKLWDLGVRMGAFILAFVASSKVLYLNSEK